MSNILLYIHLVWGTKNREPVLLNEPRTVLFKHIQENAFKKHIVIDRINGYLDHVHCLLKLDGKQSVSDIAQLLKGESSYWG